MKAFSLNIFLALSLPLLLARGNAQPTPPVGTKPADLRVGVCPNSPPMIFKQGDRIVGVEADLAEALGRETGRPIVFVEEKWEDLIDALCEDRIDIIMSTMSITPARRYRISFSDPYLKVGQMALARADEKYKYLANLAAQAKRGIGVKAGTTGDLLVRQEFPKVERKYYSNGDKAAEALIKKKIDLYINDAPMIWYLAGLYEAKGLAVTPLVLTQEELGWGIRRTDTDLLNAANKFLQKAQASGELNRILGKWMPGFR